MADFTLKRSRAADFLSRGTEPQRRRDDMFTVQPRNLWFTKPFPVLADAIAFALAAGEPCDVSAPSGAFVWVWEQRP